MCRGKYRDIMIHDENKSTAITSGTLLHHIHETKIDTTFRFAYFDRYDIKCFLVKSIFGGCHKKTKKIPLIWICVD